MPVPGSGARDALQREQARLDHDRRRLRAAPRLLLERRRSTLEHAAGRLRALSPRATVQRGYAIVRKDGALVRSATAVVAGDEIGVEVADGSFDARVA